MTLPYMALVDTAVFHETDDVFREHVLWDVAGPLLVGIGIAVATAAIRRWLARLDARRKRRERERAEWLAVRRAIAYLLEQQAEKSDPQAREILDELEKGEEKWR